jgi:hypothetical protein
MSLGRGRDARTIRGAAATAGFFPLLGVRAARGRFFLPDEDDTMRPAQVAVIGDAFWRTQLAADPNVVGTTIDINNLPHTLVGVAPRGFTGIELGRVDVWVPMSLVSQTVSQLDALLNGQWLYVRQAWPGMSFSAASETRHARTARRTTDVLSDSWQGRGRRHSHPVYG